MLGQVATSFAVNKVFLQGVADYLGIGIDVASQWSSTSIVMAQGHVHCFLTLNNNMCYWNLQVLSGGVTFITSAL